MRGERPEEPTYDNAHRSEPPYSLAGMAQFAKIEAQAAFEQDQRDAHRHHRFEQFAECVFGIEQAEDRSGEKACGEHQHDGRPTGPPRDPLRTDAENAHEGDDDRLFFHGLSRVAPDWCSSRRD